jgi:mycothiol maleylpyruvate isomerase-like protein
MSTTKVELITALERGRREWDSVLAAIDEHALMEPGVEGAWSVQQIVAHVAGYEAWATSFLTDRRDPSAGALAAFEVHWQRELDIYRQYHPNFPARMSETDDDQTNAVVVAAYDRLSALDVLARERQIYQRLLAAIKALPETQLAERWREGGRSLLEILPNQSYDHYQTHLPSIRSWLARRQSSEGQR